MSASLRSQLDGPKWAPVNDGKRLHSESQLPKITTASRKPPTKLPSAALQSRVAGSSKRLFVSPEQADSTPNSSSRDSSLNEGDVEPTPRASQLGGDSSFFVDFLPAYPPQALVNDIVGVATRVAGAAKVVSSSLRTEGINLSHQQGSLSPVRVGTYGSL